MEDYRVTIASPAGGQRRLRRPDTISTAADGAGSVFAADVDGDGDLDVLCASFHRRQDRLVRERRQPELHAAHDQHAADGAHSVFAADVDGDGDLDVLCASRDDDKIAWYENDGSQNFTPAHDQHARPTGRTACLRRTWTATATWTCSARRMDDNKIAWYENDGSENFTPTRSATAADGAAQRVCGGRGRGRRHGRALRVAR